MSLKFHITLKSKNKKTGKIPVTISPRSTCPDSCSLKGGGCYADSGPLFIHWGRVSRRERGLSWDEFCNTIRQLPEGQSWRHNQAGDLLGENGLIDKRALEELVDANMGKRGFTYTHYSVEDGKIGKFNADCIKYAISKGFIINLSADNLKQADRFIELDIAPVTVLLPSSFQNKTFLTLQKNRGIVCPAASNNTKIISCAKCMLCAKPYRNFIIGFPAHGTGKRKVDQLIIID